MHIDAYGQSLMIRSRLQVYGRAFGELDELERKVERGQDDSDESEDEEDDEDRPALGGVAASAAHVTKFYSYWNNFATKRKFYWCDKWRLSEVPQHATPDAFISLHQYVLVQAPDRRIRRLMEKDNKKERDAARRYVI